MSWHSRLTAALNHLTCDINTSEYYVKRVGVCAWGSTVKWQYSIQQTQTNAMLHIRNGKWGDVPWNSVFSLVCSFYLQYLALLRMLTDMTDSGLQRGKKKRGKYAHKNHIFYLDSPQILQGWAIWINPAVYFFWGFQMAPTPVASVYMTCPL